ncbi:PhzF family phenazine biosynthesis protein [Xylariales sp. PMI_506]|nr:PhzF family phenazine biosynthesis protein [Xylariales sp. PMI_506]
MAQEIHLVDVFTAGGKGGNLAPVILDATGWSESQMRGIARRHERESAFVFPAEPASGVDFQLRFFVPEHEMEMCGHATVGTAYVMHDLGQAAHSDLKFMTKSGPVATRRAESGGQTFISVSQPKGIVTTVSDEALISEILSVLNIDATQLGPWPIQNASTSRVKTAIPLKSVEVLNTLQPDFSRVQGICEKLNSTGLYPYAISSREDSLEVEARQFPKSSGYPEDAATGIAAAALAYALASNGLLAPGQEVIVYQGRSMGFLSQISVQLEENQCWVGGACVRRTQ